MRSLGQLLEDGAAAINTRIEDAVAAPFKLNTLFLQGEEDDQATNSDGAGEGRSGDTEGVYQYEINDQA